MINDNHPSNRAFSSSLRASINMGVRRCKGSLSERAALFRKRCLCFQWTSVECVSERERQPLKRCHSNQWSGCDACPTELHHAVCQLPLTIKPANQTNPLALASLPRAWRCSCRLCGNSRLINSSAQPGLMSFRGDAKGCTFKEVPMTITRSALPKQIRGVHEMDFFKMTLLNSSWQLKRQHWPMAANPSSQQSLEASYLLRPFLRGLPPLQDKPTAKINTISVLGPAVTQQVINSSKFAQATLWKSSFESF